MYCNATIYAGSPRPMSDLSNLQAFIVQILFLDVKLLVKQNWLWPVTGGDGLGVAWFGEGDKKRKRKKRREEVTMRGDVSTWPGETASIWGTPWGGSQGGSEESRLGVMPQ